MDFQALDVDQLKALETQLFDEFTMLDRILAAKQERMQQIEEILTHIVAIRKSKEQNEEVIVEDPRPISPPVYGDEERLCPTTSSSSEDTTWSSGPFEIRKTGSGEVDSIVCDLGRHSLLVERDSDGRTACWRIQEKHPEFVDAVNKWKRMRARFDQRQILKHEFELLIHFEERTYGLWGLYQQTVVGNINVPKLDYMEPREEAWMWSWIHGNKRWHAWNKCKGLSKSEASALFIEEVLKLEEELPNLIEEWKDEQDPRIPDQKAYVPEEEKEERQKMIDEAKEDRRRRAAAQRAEEEAKGWWDE